MRKKKKNQTKNQLPLTHTAPDHYIQNWTSYLFLMFLLWNKQILPGWDKRHKQWTGLLGKIKQGHYWAHGDQPFQHCISLHGTKKKKKMGHKTWEGWDWVRWSCFNNSELCAYGRDEKGHNFLSPSFKLKVTHPQVWFSYGTSPFHTNSDLCHMFLTFLILEADSLFSEPVS